MNVMTENITVQQVFICSRCKRERKLHLNGMCQTCYIAWRAIQRHLVSPMIPCACECGEMIHSIKRSGKPAKYKFGHGMKGRSHPQYKGGRITSGKYIKLFRPHHKFAIVSKYVYEHRYEMELQLGRYLKKGEVVHHKNKNTHDNRIENLELFESSSKHNKERHFSDMSKRRCITCGSKKTRIRKGRPSWSRHPVLKNEFECSNCYTKRKRLRIYGSNLRIYQFFTFILT